MSTLYRGGFVYSPADPFANAMVVDGGTIAWIGGDDAAAVHADGVDEVVDLGGALVTPAFVDAHAHLSQTGAALRGVDVSGRPPSAVALSRVEDAARARQGRPLYAPNWDERRWPERRSATAAELDRATYGGVVYMPRVDGHSAVISSALAAASGAQQQPGWMGEGLVDPGGAPRGPRGVQRGHQPRPSGAPTSTWPCAPRQRPGSGSSRRTAGASCPRQRTSPTCSRRGRGVTARRPWGTGRSSSRSEQEARETAAALGAHGLAGDLNVDGSIGSRTAHLRDPYADAEGRCGNGYLSVEQVRDHVASCSLAGIQGGFHVIGDAGVATVVAGIEAAADLVGADVVRRARHRLEHLEMIDAEGISRLVALGVTASVQPAFDAHWGGGEGMYAARLGRERAPAHEPLRHDARRGHDPRARLGLPGHPVRAVGGGPGLRQPPLPPTNASPPGRRSSPTPVAVGAPPASTTGATSTWATPATFAVWAVGDLVVQAPDDRIQTWSTDPRSGTPGLPDLSPGAPMPSALRTVVRGRTVFDAGGLS